MVPKTSGGTGSAEYCYSVWLRHLVHAHARGLDTAPKTLAELGPGDSLGIGLAALLSGAEWYRAFDAVSFAGTQHNLVVFDALVALFERRAPIPQLSGVRPAVGTDAFPFAVLDEGRMKAALAPARLARLRRDIATGSGAVTYRAPWTADSVLERGSVDAIVSQAVLEHVDDLDGAYAAMARWLRPGGWMSHQIDFKSHSHAREWNGHWAYGPTTWRIIRGRRPYALNREPCSTHLRLLDRHGFDVVGEERVERVDGLPRYRLASPFSELEDRDLQTSGALLLSVRRPSAERARARGA